MSWKDPLAVLTVFEVALAGRCSTMTNSEPHHDLGMGIYASDSRTGGSNRPISYT